jgi:hypothetical protein
LELTSSIISRDVGVRSLQVATVRSWLPLRFTKVPIYGKIKYVPNHQPDYQWDYIMGIFIGFDGDINGI